MDARPEASEAVGVFFLVLAGGGAILAGAGSLAVALTFAFVVAILVYAVGHVGGAHFNPAITIGFAVTGHFPWRRVPAYLAAQVAGALLAAGTLRLAFGEVDAAATHVSTGTGPLVAVLVEGLATFLLAFVIIAVATDRRAAAGMGGLAIGLAVGVGALWAGSTTGASMNPARSLGPALVAGSMQDLWLYLAVPVAGAVAGMLAYEALRGGHKPSPPERPLGAAGPFDLDRDGT